MATKKKALEHVTLFTNVPNELTTKKFNGLTVTRSIMKTKTINYESAAISCLDHVGFTGRITEFGKTTMIPLSTQEPKLCKDGHMSYTSFQNPTKTAVLIQLDMYGNTDSRVLHRVIGMGLNARQIGQLRRWHKADWRTATVKIK